MLAVDAIRYKGGMWIAELVGKKML